MHTEQLDTANGAALGQFNAGPDTQPLHLRRCLLYIVRPPPSMSTKCPSLHEMTVGRGAARALALQRNLGIWRVAGVHARASGGRLAHPNARISQQSAGGTPAGRAAGTAATLSCAVVLGC